MACATICVRFCRGVMGSEYLAEGRDAVESVWEPERSEPDTSAWAMAGTAGT
jgi:hypothetical protein